MRRWQSAIGFFLGRWYADADSLVGELRPAATADDAQQPQQLHRRRICFGWSRNNRTVFDHPSHYFFAQFGAYNAQGPVIIFTDAAGRNICVLGREVWAHLATLASPFVTFFQINFVIRAVAHPNLKHTLDIHLDHFFFFQTIFRQEQFFENCIVKSF